MVRIDIALFCLCIPLVFGAPADESVKQQLSSGLFRNDDGYWNMLNSADSGSEPPLSHYSNDAFEVRTRGGLDSLGQGNLLRSLGGLDGAGEWGNSGKASSWRIDSPSGYKRGGGLDSLGRGNLLRRVNNEDEMYNFARSLTSLGRGNLLRSLDSLGGGNILKRAAPLPFAFQSSFHHKNSGDKHSFE